MSKSKESVIYELGRLLGQSVHSPERVSAMVDELIEAGVLIDEDGRGNGWVVLDGQGHRAQPLGVDKVWEDKGSAFLYWWGLGEPEGYQLVVYADPRVEADIVFDEEGIETAEDAIVEHERVAQLRVVHD